MRPLPRSRFVGSFSQLVLLALALAFHASCRIAGRRQLGWVGRLQGLTVDKLGHIYIAGAESHTSGEAVAVISPDGKKVVAMILGVPRNISGLAFGGKHGRTLFLTGAGEYRLHQVQLPVEGAGR